MSPAWSFWNLFRASLLPCGILLALSLAGASPVEAATTAAAPQATPTGSSPERMDSAQRAVMEGRGRVKLGTLEMARLKPRSNSSSGAGATPLVYHGGQVQEVPQVYISFWGQDWNAAGHQAAETYLQGFFGSVGGSPWLAVNSQYCSGTLAAPQTSCSGGSSVRPITNPAGQLKGTWIDNTAVTYTSPASACALSSQDPGDCDVMKAADRAARHFGSLPRGAVIMVFSPHGLSQPGFVSGGWCAYHWSTVSTGAAFGYMPYLPDGGASCGANSVPGGSGAFDGFSIVGGHEYAEAITDPYPNSGWIDNSGAENGDKCAWTGLGNITLAGRGYPVQPTWSNATNSCQIAYNPAAFASQGGTLTSAPAASSWGAGRVDVFARGTGNALIHTSNGGGTWETVGGVLSAEPAAVSWSPGRLDVFVRGSDNALWHNAGDGSRWFGWESLGGVLKTGPTVSSWSAGRLDIFATGSDNALWHKSWTGSGWGGWEALGGVTAASPAAVSWGPNRVDIFVQGSDNALWHKWWSGSGWGGWETLGGTLSWSPAVTSTGSAQLSIFTRGSDNAIWRKDWNNGWTGFQSVGGGQWPTGPAATSPRGTGKIDLFTRGPDNALWHAQV
jgi:hypothetical protein